MEIDIEPIIAESKKKLKNESLIPALEYLSTFEKQARNNADMTRSISLLNAIIDLCYEAKDWKILNEQISLLAKKRGQIKQAITEMIKKSIQIMEETSDPTNKMTLINTLREVTLGKIFLEVERARISRTLSQIKEKEGMIKEAGDILFELQVETFGSMEPDEKIDFLLEQMRLGLLMKDFVRTQIVSKKVNIKSLKENERLQEKKLTYYDMMIQLALHEKDYMGCAKNFLEIYNTKVVKESHEKLTECLKNVVIFTILSPFNLEQSLLMILVDQDRELKQLPSYKHLLTLFIKKELMRWPLIEETFYPELSQMPIFGSATESGQDGWSTFKTRVIEHNIRIIWTYYTRISMKRMMTLLDADLKTTEDAIANLVVNKTIYAKIDRPSGMIVFTPRRDPDDRLQLWAGNVHQMLDLVVRINHLISKEEMVHSISGGGDDLLSTRLSSAD